MVEGMYKKPLQVQQDASESVENVRLANESIVAIPAVFVALTNIAERAGVALESIHKNATLFACARKFHVVATVEPVAGTKSARNKAPAPSIAATKTPFRLHPLQTFQDLLLTVLRQQSYV